jgi:hypothetical protein
MMERLKTNPVPVYEEELPGSAAVAQLEVPEPAPERSCAVRVIHGASDINLDIAGQTVGQVRPVLDAILGIGPRAIILVDGVRVREDHVLTVGSAIEIVKRAGEKGAGPHGSAH